MRKLLFRWAISALAVYVATRIVGGITVDGQWTVLFGVALILGLVNAVIAPIVRVLTCPLIILSLGVFTLVINAAMLLLTAAIARGLGIGFAVKGFGPAFLGAVVISAVSFVLSLVTGVNARKARDD
jgi:putative membrane protein